MNKKFTVKICDKIRLQFYYLLQEINLLKKFRSKNIVNLIEIDEDKNDVYLFFEYCK